MRKGVTLIALVVTIIILLILAAVSIALLIGPDGMITKANESKTISKQAETRDRISTMVAAKMGDTANHKYGFANFEADYIGNTDADNKAFTYNEDKTKVIDRINNAELTTEEVKSLMGEGKLTIPADLKVGDYVNYTPTAATAEEKEELRQNWITYSGWTTTADFSSDKFDPEPGMKWQVFEIDRNQGKVLLISENPTTKSLYTKGLLGYNNCVKLVDDYCKILYSNKEKGIYARNLKIEDIERNMDLSHWDYKTYDNGVQYGNRNNLTTYLQYPSLIEEEKLPTVNKHKIDGGEVGGPIGQSEQPEYYTEAAKPIKTATTSLENVQTYWQQSKISYSYKDQKLKDIIHKSQDYHLSSRYVNTYSSASSFGVRNVGGSGVGWDRFGSDGYSGGNSLAFRAVLDLGSETELEKVSEGNWNIK